MKSRRREPRPAAAVLALVLMVGCAVPRVHGASAVGPPNFDFPTLGGLQLWADVAWADGWRVQRHAWTRHHRLLDPSNVRRAWGRESHCLSRLELLAAGGSPDSGELVVLLHGLGRTRYSFGAMRAALEEQGHRVVSLSYPSTRAPLDEHAERLGRLLERLQDVERVSFVTHSLGGRVVLRLLEQGGEWTRRIELGRVVQIAPPNGGSKLASDVRYLPWIARILGPTLYEVAQAEPHPPPADVEIGVIAGVRGADGGWNPLLPGDDDGVVALSETCLDGPHEHKAVRGLHTFLMRDAAVVAATARFLTAGTFASE